MSKELIRIGVYWYPPRELACVMEQLWDGTLATRYQARTREAKEMGQDDAREYEVLGNACDLVARHCGDCPIWRSHATILDAICIVADDRQRFVKCMGDVTRKFLPIVLHKPQIKEWGWGHSVFLGWEDGHGPGIDRLKALRKAVAEAASEFMVVERVSWEAINDMERLITALGGLARSSFRRAVDELDALLRAGGAPRLPHAPNIGLDWYIDRLIAGRELRDDRLPFPPDPHISIATGIRADEKYGFTAKGVGDFIKEHLSRLEELRGLLGQDAIHSVGSVHVVEPAGPSVAPLEVTVVDRATGRERLEFRQPWQAAEEILVG